ncbi:MAG: site-2 protease family protein [Deltaproteobacteria bacterium]
MFGNKIRLFKLFGFEVSIDASWLIIAFLITWSLAAGVFPFFYPRLSTAAYWWMGIAGTVGLFMSIVVHEMMHSLVARRYGLPMKGITLFIFGGVAEMSEEPSSAKAEFSMAVAGPLTSIVAGFVCWLIVLGGQRLSWSLPVLGVVAYLSWINVILAIFNLVPAFPLDGGRVFRAALWSFTGSYRRASRIAAAFGSGFGLVLSLLGVLFIFTGALISGIWWILIGMFLRSAAQMSYQRVVINSVLRGVPVKRFMQPRPVTAPAALPVDRLVDDYFYRYHFSMFPVVQDGGRLVGCVRTQDLKGIARQEWNHHTVNEITHDCSRENSINPDADAVEALNRMNTTGSTKLLVTRKEELVGIVTLRDLLGFLSLKLDLEGEDLRK